MGDMNCWWLSVDMIENGGSEWYILNCLDGSMVEHLSSKQKVAGSSPVLSNFVYWGHILNTLLWVCTTQHILYMDGLQ